MITLRSQSLRFKRIDAYRKQVKNVRALASCNDVTSRRTFCVQAAKTSDEFEESAVAQIAPLPEPASQPQLCLRTMCQNQMPSLMLFPRPTAGVNCADSEHTDAHQLVCVAGWTAKQMHRGLLCASPLAAIVALPFRSGLFKVSK